MSRAPDRERSADVEPCDEYEEGDRAEEAAGPDGRPYCEYCGWARDLHEAFLRKGQM